MTGIEQKNAQIQIAPTNQVTTVLWQKVHFDFFLFKKMTLFITKIQVSEMPPSGKRINK